MAYPVPCPVPCPVPFPSPHTSPLLHCPSAALRPLPYSRLTPALLLTRRTLYHAHERAASRVGGGGSQAAAAAAAPRRRGMGGMVDGVVNDAGDAASNTTVAQWEAAMRSVALAQPAAAEGAHASRRPIMLTLDDVKRHDLSFPWPWP